MIRTIIIVGSAGGCTPTVHLGTPTDRERECFTLVLKGHIRLARAVFARLVLGANLATFSRQYLWSHGLDYLLGTGHGVGMFLNVLEGPSSISSRVSPDNPGGPDTVQRARLLRGRGFRYTYRESGGVSEGRDEV